MILQERLIQKAERALFLKTWLKHPKQMGTLAPVSGKLAQEGVSFLPMDGRILEIGAGTGRLTRAMIRRNIPLSHIMALELDPNCCRFLEQTLPGLRVVQGDAVNSHDYLPKEWGGQVDAILSSIPFMYLEQSTRNRILDGILQCLKPNGKIIHVTYHPLSCFSHRDDLVGRRLKSLFFNIPPGFVWEFKRKSK